MTLSVSFHESTSAKSDQSLEAPAEEATDEHEEGSSRQFSGLLRNEDNRLLFLQHKRYLHHLVVDGWRSLESIGYFRSSSHGSSLRSMLTGKLDRSNHSSIHKLEADLSEATDDLTDFSEHRFEGNLVFDFDEQQRVTELCSRMATLPPIHSMDLEEEFDLDDDEASFALPEQSFEESFIVSPVPVPKSNCMIALTPELKVPLRGASETWQAIQRDSTIVTSCNGCQTELHVIEDAAYVVCLDCWKVGSAEQTVGGIHLELEEDSDEKYGIALGVKCNEVLRWVEDRAVRKSFGNSGNGSSQAFFQMPGSGSGNIQNS